MVRLTRRRADPPRPASTAYHRGTSDQWGYGTDVRAIRIEHGTIRGAGEPAGRARRAARRRDRRRRPTTGATTSRTRGSTLDGMAAAGHRGRPVAVRADARRSSRAAARHAPRCCWSAPVTGAPSSPPPIAGVQWGLGALSQADWAGAGARATSWPAPAYATTRWRSSCTARIAGRSRTSPGVHTFSRSLPLAKALHPDTMLALDMNGAPLHARARRAGSRGRPGLVRDGFGQVADRHRGRDRAVPWCVPGARLPVPAGRRDRHRHPDRPDAAALRCSCRWSTATRCRRAPRAHRHRLGRSAASRRSRSASTPAPWEPAKITSSRDPYQRVALAGGRRRGRRSADHAGRTRDRRTGRHAARCTDLEQARVRQQQRPAHRGRRGLSPFAAGRRPRLLSRSTAGEPNRCRVSNLSLDSVQKLWIMTGSGAVRDGG